MHTYTKYIYISHWTRNRNMSKTGELKTNILVVYAEDKARWEYGSRRENDGQN